MPTSENTGRIVLDRAGRIIELSDDLLTRSWPLHVGDRLSFIGFDGNGPTEINIRTAIDDLAVGPNVKRNSKKLVASDFKLEVCESSPMLESAPGEQALSKSPQVMEHAIETFGSREAAEEWLSIECGALQNESPADFIRKTGDVAEVERILHCIDYGMIA